VTGPLGRAERLLRARGVTGRRAFEVVCAAIEDAIEGRGQDLFDETPDSVLAGRAWERFLPDLFRARDGQFFTPAPLADVLVAHLGDINGAVVLDPMCGAGGMLVAAARAGARVIGVERDPDLAALARLACRAAGVSATIEVGDGFQWSGRTDIVLTNPPFSQRRTEPSALSRNGSVPSELLLLERACDWLGSAGRAALIVPWSVAGTRRAAGARALLTDRLPLERVLRLPEGAFRPFGGAAGRVALVWLRRGPAGPVAFGDVADPGWDVRLRRLVRTGGRLEPDRWLTLGPGEWEPPAAGGARPLGDVATVRRERWSERGPADLLDLADATVGGLMPRRGAVMRRGRWRLRRGDVLLPRLRTSTGTAVLVERDALSGSPEWLALSFPEHRHFAVHALRTPAFRRSLPQGAGQTRPRISEADLLAAPIPWAPAPLRAAVEHRSAALHAERARVDAALGALQTAVDDWADSGDDGALVAALKEAP
jgi:hypothetical protein